MSRTSRVRLILLLTFCLVVGCGGGASDSDREGNAGKDPGTTQRESPQRETALVTVPEGTVFVIALDQGLSSKTNSRGDPVQAHAVSAIRSEGQVVVEEGAKVRGVVTEVEGSDRIKGRAFVALNFTSVETVDGPRNVETTMVDGTLEAKGTKKRDAAIIVGGAAAGAVIGEILGDAKLGAIIGGAAGTGVVLATKGAELEVEPGTTLNLKLLKPLEVTVTKGYASAH